MLNVELLKLNSLIAFKYFNFFHKWIPFFKGNAIAECFGFNTEFEADADVGYQAPLTRCWHDLPQAHFYRSAKAHCLYRHDRFHDKQDGEQFPKIKITYAKMKCKICFLEMRTYCLCNCSKPMCTQCHGKHEKFLTFSYHPHCNVLTIQEEENALIVLFDYTSNDLDSSNDLQVLP